jgi:3-dehydroquinate synthase
MPVIKIASRIHDYEVFFPPSAEFFSRIESIPQRLIVIDANVWRLYRHSSLAVFDSRNVFPFHANEERKTLEGVAEIHERLLDCAAKRNMTLIAIGGGIVQDVVGFAASTLYRGIRWVYVPTTLLAQADSCIGGKTSLNYKGFKNLLGTFYPPHEVFIYPGFLETLTELDYYSGLGEVLKLHLMGGAETTCAYLADVEKIHERDSHVLSKKIRVSLKVKQSFLEGDGFDLGRRALLNYGHCYGHALETVSGFTIPHGQAVLIGMLFANRVACQRKILRTETCEKMRAIIEPHIRVSPCFEEGTMGERIALAMQKDKKRTGTGLALVMMGEGYEMVRVDDLSLEELAMAHAELSREWIPSKC